MSGERHTHIVEDVVLPAESRLPDGAVGIDAGLTLTKVARAEGRSLRLEARETVALSRDDEWRALAGAPGRGVVGITGARLGRLRDEARVVEVPEIDAGARGAVALLRSAGREPPDAFVLAVLGTGTAFAAVRGSVATHLGGTPLGGGSFVGVARRVLPGLTYEQMIVGARRGDRRKVDVMIGDVYPAGIGRVRPDLTAVHLALATRGTLDDFLAGLLNLHGENIGQIAASRARIAGVAHIVLAGGFVHSNPALLSSLTAMIGMFGVSAEVTPSPGFAGAVGAALLAVEAT